ncbi:hypothetical protein CFE70_008178 [Pyrenophora teres f. teres 0-1]|uniref:Uncharacterized protein n=2 Tax=Pyrenophora teres f. teres TaxID=97479 RepID=E3S506_PYRTT|nr:hypothetical protein PTT_17682 [Pyrenophora teres f. teres 0-1]KAE8828893.1 hypothetical protein PTNB85_08081 [Pyrenophora teres f. teres]CAA9964784.1 hypothetical protein PTMSG1_08143 [Pyrenophora teres f. maculata]KAE8830054.1 hypothetical protein HRS9139_06678 [Pyrenophora teres f. teres]KAE8841606.1 hypothetical protein HRS9122_05732 [Pyrenophora teres f. teres]
MCYALLQVYVCSHEKTVCNTPCPRAIATGLRLPRVNAAMTRELSRSSSVVSSTAPAAASRSDVQDLPSQRAGDAQDYPSLLRIGSQGTPGRQQDGAPPAFRFVGQDQEPLPPPPSYAQLSRTSSTLSQQPSPNLSTAGTLVNQSPMLPTPGETQVDDW